jgi:hypothetical protein
MYLVGWLEKCSFRFKRRFGTSPSTTSCAPSQSDPPNANWTHQDKDKETSQGPSNIRRTDNV